jgi:hypothetical protein
VRFKINSITPKKIKNHFNFEEFSRESIFDKNKQTFQNAKGKTEFYFLSSLRLFFRKMNKKNCFGNHFNIYFDMF